MGRMRVGGQRRKNMWLVQSIPYLGPFQSVIRPRSKGAFWNGICWQWERLLALHTSSGRLFQLSRAARERERSVFREQTDLWMVDAGGGGGRGPRSQVGTWQTEAREIRGGKALKSSGSRICQCAESQRCHRMRGVGRQEPVQKATDQVRCNSVSPFKSIETEASLSPPPKYLVIKNIHSIAQNTRSVELQVGFCAEFSVPRLCSPCFEDSTLSYYRGN